jgi:hypothetical protein
MANNALHDTTWDTAASLALRFGALKVPLVKLSPPKEDVKVEKIREVGNMLATKRTPGIVEVGDGTAELLASVYEALILPRMPKHGGTLTQFVITSTYSHPSVEGALGFLYDRCRIIGEEDPAIESSEKGAIVKLTVSVMERWKKGRDGVWKCLALKPGLPSSTAQALLSF